MKFARGQTTQLAFIVGHSLSCMPAYCQPLVYTETLMVRDNSQLISLQTALHGGVHHIHIVRPSSSLRWQHKCRRRLQGSEMHLYHYEDLLRSPFHHLQRGEQHDGGHRRKEQLIYQQLANHSCPACWPLRQDVCLQELQQGIMKISGREISH